MKRTLPSAALLAAIGFLPALLVALSPTASQAAMVVTQTGGLFTFTFNPDQTSPLPPGAASYTSLGLTTTSGVPIHVVGWSGTNFISGGNTVVSNTLIDATGAPVPTVAVDNLLFNGTTLEVLGFGNYQPGSPSIPFTVAGGSLTFDLTGGGNILPTSDRALSFGSYNPGVTGTSNILTTTPPPPEIAVFDRTDSVPGVPLIDGQAGVVNFGCTQPGVPLTRDFEVRNQGGVDMVLPAAGLSLPAGYTMNPPWPTAVITPEFKVVVTKADAGATADDSTFFELITMPSQLSVDSVKFRIPDSFTTGSSAPQPQRPYIQDGSFAISGGTNIDIVNDVSTSFDELLYIQGGAPRWQSAVLSFTRGVFTGSLEDPSQNSDLTFGFGIANLNPPAVPGAQNDGDGYGQAGIEVIVVLYNSLTDTTETVTGVFVDDGINNDRSEATFTASPIEIPVPVFIPAGQSWTDVVGTPLTVQLLSATEGVYAGDWSLANNDADENPFNFPITGIVDGTAPAIVNLPLDIEVTAASGTCEAVVHWVEPSVSDNLDPTPTLAQTDGPVSGSTFPVGTTVIEYTASDCAGNMTVETFEVRVLDTVPPSLVGCLPARVVANLPPGETSVVVNYPPLSAIDNCDPNPSVICTPPSGSTFGLGVHTVTCYAEDSSGNQSPPESFIVVVVETQVSPTPRNAEVVVERNEETPGVAGGAFSVVNHALLNEAGGVLIEATMSGAGTGAVGVWKDVGSGLELVSRDGDLAPGVGSFPIKRYDDLMLNDSGAVALEAFLDGATPVTDARHLSDVSGALLASISEGATIPGGSSEVFSILQEPAFDGTGATLTPANLLIDNVLVNSGNDTGIWRKPVAGALEQVAREGGLVGTAIPGAEYGQVASRVVANASGEVAFFAFLKVGPGGVTIADNAAVFAGTPGSLSVVAREDEVAPGSDPALFSTFNAESINSSGRVAFEAALKTGGGGPAVVAATNTGVYTNSNGSLELVAREGDPVNPCGPPGAVFSSFRDIFIADNGDVFFQAFLTGPSVGSENDGGLWRWRASSSKLEPVLIEGEVAPSTQGAVLASLLDCAVSDGGAQAVSATLVPGVGDCTLTNNFGLWMDDGSNGVPILRVREGDEVDLSLPSETPVLTVLFLDQTTNAAGGSGGHGKVLNDLGEVIVRTAFDQNTSGAIILSNEVPN